MVLSLSMSINIYFMFKNSNFSQICNFKFSATCFTLYVIKHFRDKMAMVAHLVGIDQLGYEKELGMTPSVS